MLGLACSTIHACAHNLTCLHCGERFRIPATTTTYTAVVLLVIVRCWVVPPHPVWASL